MARSMRSRFALPLAVLSCLVACHDGTRASGERPDGHDGEQTRSAGAQRTPRPRPAGTFEGAPVSLLDEYAGRPPVDPDEAARWQLPYQAKRIVVSLLAAAAEDRIEDLPLLLAPDARWGLPDRRQIESRPVFAGDGGATFFDAFRSAAARFKGRDRAQPGGRSATFVCPPMPPGPEDAVRSGAEPYWCYFVSGDRLDLLVFRLMVERGRAWITYVGLFPTRPSGPVAVARDDAPPPLAPPVIRGPADATPPPARPRPATAPSG